MELVEWLREQTWSEFAQSLADWYDDHGALTPKQAAAAESMRAKVQARQPVRQAHTVDVPTGRYAVGDPLRFYKVERPTEGRWAGYTFIKVMASDDEWPIRNRATREDVLKEIARNPATAMQRYGQEIGRCGRCGRTLTDEESRRLGIGPICRDLL